MAEQKGHPIIDHTKESYKKGYEIGSNKEIPINKVIEELSTTIKDEYKTANELTKMRTDRKKAVAKRLSSLREEADLKQKEVSQKTGINVTTLSGYELGRNEPNVETLVRLADLYDVSLDYLLCRTDEKYNFRKRENKEIRETKPDEQGQSDNNLEERVRKLEESIKVLSSPKNSDL